MKVTLNDGTILEGTVKELCDYMLFLATQKDKGQAVKTEDQPPKVLVTTRKDLVAAAKNDISNLRRLAKCLGIAVLPAKVGKDKTTTVISSKGGKGKAVLSKGDVFNAYIGEAVALYHLLGIKLPEYYFASIPVKGVQVGDVIRFAENEYKIVTKKEMYEVGKAELGSYVAKFGKVIDDTHREEYK